MELSPGVILAALVSGGTIGAGIWQAGMHIGRLTVRVESIEERVAKHEKTLDDHDHEFRFLKGIR